MKVKMGGTRRGCMLCPEQNIYTNTVQPFRMQPDGDYGNVKRKKKLQISFCMWDVYTEVFIWQRNRSYLSKILRVALLKNKPLLLPPHCPLFHWSLEFAWDLGQWRHPPSAT